MAGTVGKLGLLGNGWCPEAPAGLNSFLRQADAHIPRERPGAPLGLSCLRKLLLLHSPYLRLWGFSGAEELEAEAGKDPWV